jgi:peptidoglycan/xylan/chitin deacetylase (PgdA/CDA1 family)
MLKKGKQLVLSSLKRTGLFRVVRNSRWRRERLLILAYHGISLNDEHQWNPGLFLPSDLFRERLITLKKAGCTVLPFAEALGRLYANDLPDNAVALTFDDGNYDFFKQAYPIIKEFDLPVTLYLTTFYTHYNRPVFDVMCSYLLWKGRGRTLDLKSVTGQDGKLELESNAARVAALDEIQTFVRIRKLSAEEKDALAEGLARQLMLDYDALLDRRFLHLINPDEIEQLAAGGVDIQLHTHRHRTPLDRHLFRSEIEDNRKSIETVTGSSSSHFCYPNGVYYPAFFQWLKELGVESATTCELGIASRSSNPLLLPRFLDSSSLSSVEFEGWLSGMKYGVP